MKQKKKKHKNKKQDPVVTNIEQKSNIKTEGELKQTLEKDYKYSLPIAEIKKDLIKTAAYAIFALGVILVLNYLLPKTGLEFDLSRYKFF